jgi:hypothetical protein
MAGLFFDGHKKVTENKVIFDGKKSCQKTILFLTFFPKII